MPKILKFVEIIYVGIDPGKQGGMATLSSSGDVSAIPMPETERDIWDWFRSVVETDPVIFACIEQVHSMPDQSAQSGFTFGSGYGGLRMALTAAEIPFDDPLPQKWMKALGIPSGKGETRGQKKEKLRAKAQQLFPELPIWKQPKSKGIQLAICDALLIAHYCRLTRR